VATPIGHIIVGLALGRAHRPALKDYPLRWYAFCALAAIFPDLDFLAGLLFGDLHRFHQGVSHSFVAALVFGVAASYGAAFFRVSRLRLAVFGFLLYASHIMLDYFCDDARAPFGVPLFWPFSSGHFIFPWPFLSGVRHGVPGDSVSDVLVQLFSWHNVWTLVVEVIFLAPILLIVMYFTGRHRGQRTFAGTLPNTKVNSFNGRPGGQ